MSIERLKYIWCGDDFTGASDTLATFAKAGAKALLCLGTPTSERLAALEQVDALGIASAARTMSPEEMRGELSSVSSFVAEQRPHLFHYKCCSTFDSAPRVGSIGAAAAIFQSQLDPAKTVIVGGQPSLDRYCVFGTLFAAAGLGGDIHRLDRHPTMANHPVTPMHEADLREHLAQQGLTEIDLVDWRSLDACAEPDLERLWMGARVPILFDVLTASHLVKIGSLLWKAARGDAPVLAIGASSVAEAVIAHWRAIDAVPEPKPVPAVPPAVGPVFVLAGSQSPTTAAQVEKALASEGAYRGVAIDVESIVTDPAAFTACADACVGLLKDGHSVIAYTGPMRDGGPSQRLVAEACGSLIGMIADRAPMVRRMGVAGGDTSSLAVTALGPWALAFAGTLCPGVTLASTRSDDAARDGLELMLKGGQMGPVDVFLLLRSGTVPE